MFRHVQTPCFTFQKGLQTCTEILSGPVDAKVTIWLANVAAIYLWEYTDILDGSFWIFQLVTWG